MIVVLKNDFITVEINTKGAELKSIIKEGFNFIWEIDEKYWNKTSPILFPIIGRLLNDSYKINNNEYFLERHGFARDYEFEIIEQSNSFIIFSLEENDQTLSKFPFQFKLQLKYELIDNQLTLEYKVKNYSSTNMPFNIGAHPAFKLPNDINYYSLHFNNDENFETNELEGDYFSGKTKIIENNKNMIKLNENLFENDALVFKNISSNKITLLYKNAEYISLEMQNFTSLGIWKKPHAPFLCIEPWTGFADSKDASGNIFEKSGIQILQPNQEFKCIFKISI